METTDYLRFVVREIHTTVVATVDEQGLPVTCAVDMMNSDENSLYFLTAKGKSFLIKTHICMRFILQKNPAAQFVFFNCTRELENGLTFLKNQSNVPILLLAAEKNFKRVIM